MPASPAFESDRHPRNALGMFVHAPVAVDERVLSSLRAQADALSRRSREVDVDHTGWREELGRVHAELDVLSAGAEPSSIVEYQRRLDGEGVYPVPGPVLRRHEELVREAGAAIDKEIRARIGDPPEEVLTGAQRERAMLRTLTGLAVRKDVIRRAVLAEVLASGVDPEQADPVVDRIAPQRRPELEEIDRRLVAAHDAIVRHTNDTVTARSLYSARYVLEMSTLVGETRALGGHLDLGPHRTSAPAQAVLAAAGTLPADWIAESNAHEPRLQVSPRFHDRGFYERESGTLALTDQEGDISGEHVAVAVHELAHRCSEANPGLAMSQWAFLHRRIRGADGRPQQPEPLRDLTGHLAYEPYEECCPDQFANPYVGRLYEEGAPGAPLEVLPVGLESLYSGGNGLYEDDDYRRFVLGALVTQ